MTIRTRISIGVIFALTLVLSWTLVTVAVALAIWSDRHAGFLRVATWASLWAFTVVVPTLNAFAIHRAVGELTNGTAPAASAERLAQLRPLLLLSANMALLSAFALIFGR
jgi:hypothetical protein